MKAPTVTCHADHVFGPARITSFVAMVHVSCQSSARIDRMMLALIRWYSDSVCYPAINDDQAPTVMLHMPAAAKGFW